MRPTILRRARLALLGFAVFLAALVWLADAGRGQWLFHLVRFIPGEDKTGHFLLFGVLAFLLNVVLHGRIVRRGRLTMLKGSLVVVLVVIAEEVSQLFFTYRTFDLLDLVADLAGIWFFGQLASRFLKHERALACQLAPSPQRRR